MKELFDNYIETSFGEYAQAHFKFRQFELNYRHLFPDDMGAPLLDIGIGRGEMLSSMKSWGYVNFHGIDISPSTVGFCQGLGLPCEQVEDTIAWLREHPSSFTLVTLLDVLEHIPKGEIIPLLTAILASLRDDGRLIVQVPNLQAPDALMLRYGDITHVSGFIEQSLRQVLMVAGFTRISCHGFNDSVGQGWKEPVRLTLRAFYWAMMRFLRKISGNMNPLILHPYFFAVACR